jgi:hypothetical protein
MQHNIAACFLDTFTMTQKSHPMVANPNVREFNLLVLLIWIAASSACCAAINWEFANTDKETDISTFATKWMPGITWGLFFGVTLLKDWAVRLALATVCGCIWFVAFWWVSEIHSYLSVSDAIILVGSGTAVVMMLVVDILVDLRPNHWWLLLVGILGAAGGWWINEFPNLLAMNKGIMANPLFYFVWQAGVGICIALGAKIRPHSNAPTPATIRLHQFLTGPIPQMIGLIATAYSIISVFRK